MEENNIVTTQEGMTECSEGGISDYGLGMIAGAILTAATYGCVKIGKKIYKKFKKSKETSRKVIVVENNDEPNTTEETNR